MIEIPPLIILAIGLATILVLIIVLRANPFLALLTAAILVSLLAPGPIQWKIARVAEAFGTYAGRIGIVIALAAIIGKAMMDSGAADRIVRAFLSALGEKRAAIALLGSGYVLSIPVFFDTVFYLLVPLARSLFKKTKKDYLKYVLAICAGGAVTHTLVPPTPGPLVMAGQLGIDLGVMILVGAAIAFPAAVVGLFTAGILNRLMPIPLRELPSDVAYEPLKESQQPALFWAALPIVLPVVLISTNTIITTWADRAPPRPITEADITDWPRFVTTLAQQVESPAPSPGRQILNSSVAGLRERVLYASQLRPPHADERLQTELLQLLNEILKDRRFYQPFHYSNVKLSRQVERLIDPQNVASIDRLETSAEIETLNRALLESAYPGIIRPMPIRRAAHIADLLGDPNLALLLSCVVAMCVLVARRGLSLAGLSHVVEVALMSGGVIILITSAGGAFGEMLKAAGIKTAIEDLFSGEPGSEQRLSGFALMALGFAIAVVLKVAQGSSTVAMITAASMVSAMGISAGELGFNPVYLATAIGSGSLVGSWMNDSGFWIYAKMGGLTEVEALKSWTVLLAVLGLVGFGMSMLLAAVLPLVAVTGEAPL